MLYLIAKYLQTLYHIPGLRLFQYITFRAGLAIVLSLIISIFFGKRIVNWLRRLQIGESVRDLGLTGQKEKEGTPTMGGVIIILAIMVPCLLLCDLTNVYILLMLFATTWMAIIGFVDDYIKVFRKKKDGLDGKFKIAGQIGLGLIVALTMLFNEEVTVRMEKEKAENLGYHIVKRTVVEDHRNQGTFKDMVYVKTTLTNVPFMKGNQFEYGDLLPSSMREKWVWLLFTLIVIFIITAVSNAANLTDGLDGLATGISAIIGGTLGVLAYVSSNTIFADYLNIFYLPATSELVIFCACFIGACIGFLWYNAYPATVFMG
ncbi:MAG TPA: phospho-N-acetylmuramoyl-pentapeptide-transferase, partial [Saprospiraceae bacterium]|nr:phospho-N-acetylmuramoyl-pentapeptide-transferase [Saprospiraceae bacterium]